MRRGVMAGTKLGARHLRVGGPALARGAAGELRAPTKTGGPKLTEGRAVAPIPAPFSVISNRHALELETMSNLHKTKDSGAV